METRSIKHGLKFLLVFCCILVMQVLPVQAAEQIAETAIGVEQIFKTEYSAVSHGVFTYAPSPGIFHKS